jgi:HlyD family secretion protein
MKPIAKRLLVWGIPALLLLGAIILAFQPRPVPVDLRQVTRGTLLVTIDEEGETRVHDAFVVSAPISGRVQRAVLHAGDQVTANETVVASIVPSDPSFLDPRSRAVAEANLSAASAAERLARADIAQAEAELDFARSELTRMRSLAAKGTVSEQAVDDAERVHRTRTAALAAAQASLGVRQHELERARAALISPADLHRNSSEDCGCVEITAPVSGKVLRILQQSEAVVEAGAALLEIGNPADLEIVTDLLSSDAVRVEAGQPVLIEGWGGTHALNGVVQRVEPYGFTKISALGIEEQRVNVIIELADPYEQWSRLGHGFRVDLRIVIAELDDTLIVPLTALFRDNDKWAIFVAMNGRAVKREVDVGRRAGLVYEVRSGLTEGEQVIMHPSERVSDGIKITQRGQVLR